MKQLLWFVSILTVSLNCNAKPLDNSTPADYYFYNQQVLVFMHNFPTNTHREIPIYNEETGDLVTFMPPSAATAAYILINVPREQREQTLRSYGIIVHKSFETE
jgi:hypothetical protein